MQQQLQQYFVLHTYFQAYGEKIPISEITLLLKNHQIWQYFKKRMLGRQVVVENEAEVNRRKQTTTTYQHSRLLDLLGNSHHTFFIRFSLARRALCTMGPFCTNSKYILLQCSTFFILHHLSHIKVQYSPLFGRRDLKITCKCLPGWWGK